VSIWTSKAWDEVSCNRASVRLYICLSHHSAAARRRGGFAAVVVGPAGVRYRSIATWPAGPTAANASNAVVFSVLTLSFLVISAENTCVCVFVRMLEGSVNLLQY